MTRRTWQEIKTERLASMTPAQRATFDAAYEESSLAAQVGEQIRDARENAGISQRELARRIGSTQAVISRIEAGSVDVHLLGHGGLGVLHLHLQLDHRRVEGEALEAVAQQLEEARLVVQRPGGLEGLAAYPPVIQGEEHHQPGGREAGLDELARDAVQQVAQAEQERLGLIDGQLEHPGGRGQIARGGALGAASVAGEGPINRAAAGGTEARFQAAGGQSAQARDGAHPELVEHLQEIRFQIKGLQRQLPQKRGVVAGGHKGGIGRAWVEAEERLVLVP